ncbi:MAG: DUF3108 domain-containing protein [Elusimicrobia bacterium]|nr:DUF3108 domain-containing protein [Candidatus Liberimonas magnetica]
MKKSCLSLMLLFVFVPLKAERQQKIPFNVGEKLKYEVGWEFVKAGYATLEIPGFDNLKGNKCYHITAKVETASMFNNVFKVSDVYESWIDCNKLFSSKFLTNISEGNYLRTETLVFDQKNHIYKILESKKTGKVPASVQDVISALYSIRNKDLGVGKSYQLDAHIGDTTWPLAVRVLYKEKITVPAGDFDCFVVMPRLRSQKAVSPNVQGTLLVWLTADTNKIPVKVSCKIPLGSITADLVEMKQQ